MAQLLLVRLMPFHDYAPLADSDGHPLREPATLLKWNIREGEYVAAGTPIASLTIGGAARSFVICFPAMIEKLLAPEGAVIRPDQNVLRWIADGENIPYGKAHFRCTVSI